MLEGNLNIRVQPVENSEESKSMLLKRLDQIGSSIRFEDEKWICDKMVKDSSEIISDYTIYFTNTPDKYKDLFKYYVLTRLGTAGVRTLTASISYYKQLFDFLQIKKDYISLTEVDKRMIKDFELYLKNSDLAKTTKEGIWYCGKAFFESLLGWKGMPTRNPFGATNPFKRNRKDYKNDEKYIPDFVARQLDDLFKNELIPIHYRLVYWILRSIPSRITEVTGMKIDCLKPSYDNKLVLFIPTWKQNGGYIQSELRTIYLNPEGEFEQFLIEMIREQQHAAETLQDNISDKGSLFTYQNPWIKNGNILNKLLVGLYFRRICKEYGVKDENGNEFILSTHQLRHNGITDRIEAGFSFIEIRDMTNHKGNSMIWNAYYHPRKEIVLKRQKELLKLTKGNKEIEKPIYFRGQILNLDKQREERILKNPRAYRIMEGEHSIGICSDITGCKSNMFECLDCDYFVPNADDLEYFMEQIKVWEGKVKMFNRRKQALENAQHNLKLHKAIVRRIETQIKLSMEA